MYTTLPVLLPGLIVPQVRHHLVLPSWARHSFFSKGAPFLHPLFLNTFPFLVFPLVYHEKIILTKKEAARVHKVLNLPALERNLPSVVTEANLIKVKLLPEEVGTKVKWKKFIDGRAIGEKSEGVKRKRQESSASDSDYEDGTS